MPLEAAVLCLDNSEFMRNGDFPPSRLEQQTDAVNIIANAKTQQNSESAVGILSMASGSKLVCALTPDIGQIIKSLPLVKIGGLCDFVVGIQVAQLALKHRPNKNQRQRIIVFVASPISNENKELVKLGKKLKKNNIAVDIISFGEEEANTEKVEAFFGAVNNNDNSHLVTIPAGPRLLSDVLVASPVVVGEAAEGGGSGSAEGGAGTGDAGGATGAYPFGIDPNMDPELAMALRLSMEEEEQRQRAAAGESTDAPAQSASTTDQAATTSTAATEAPAAATPAAPAAEPADNLRDALAAGMEGGEAQDDAALLAQAIAMSMEQGMDVDEEDEEEEEDDEQEEEVGDGDALMNEIEDEEMRLALQMSLAEQEPATGSEEAKATPDPNDPTQDPAFLASVLGSLPGVDMNDERIKDALKKKDEPKDSKDKKND